MPETKTHYQAGPRVDPYDPANGRCATCRWHDVDGFYAFYGENAEGFEDMGYCRRQPPIPDPRMALVRFHKNAAEYEYFSWATWPETQPEDWCGEWAPRPPAPAGKEETR